ncbi:MAG TPA: nucleotidyltransferase family protein [Acidimicrobiia bacterium]|nr:nucleotidyltransferase family protein [Acidimicrobiia bacterium]
MARPHPLLVDLAAGRPIDPAGIDATVVESAEDHRMTGLLLDEVRTAGVEVDRQVWARLEALDLQASVGRNRLVEAAASIHDRLAAVGIDHLFFKGIVEAYRVFEAPGHRPFADIDVCLAPGESLTRAVLALEPDFPDADALDDLVEGGYTSTVGFFTAGVPIDLHIDVVRVGRGARHPAQWWEATTGVAVPGVGDLRALDREASFAVFVLHQARDRFRYLIGCAEFVRRLRAGVDLGRVKALVEAEGLWDQLAVAIEVLSSEVGIETPVTAPASWRTRLWRRLWSPDIRLLGTEGRVRNPRLGSWLMPLTARGRAWETLRWIGRSALPPDARLRRLHPEARGPYLWRVVTTRITSRWRRLAARRHQASGPDRLR